jgi:hypothetical protein
MLRNEWGMTSYPFVPGHEIIGKIAGTGEHVPLLQVGQTVGLGWYAGSCLACQIAWPATIIFARPVRPRSLNGMAVLLPVCVAGGFGLPRCRILDWRTLGNSSFGLTVGVCVGSDFDLLNSMRAYLGAGSHWFSNYSHR